MDLDNITDIEVLREELKEHMVKIKAPIEDNKNFKVGYWYDFSQDEYHVTIYDDNGGYYMMSYIEAGKILDCGNG